MRRDETQGPIAVYPVQISCYTYCGSKLEFRGQDEHGCEKLGQHLATRFCDDAARLALVPIQQKSIESLTVQVADRFARNGGVAAIDFLEFAHHLAEYTEFGPRWAIGNILLHAERAQVLGGR